MTVPLYEHPAWQQTPGRVMRPGGFEITERALSFCDLQPQSRVLDLGCGMGASLMNIQSGRAWHAYGIDTSSMLLRQARENCPGAYLAQAQGECLPFASESLDAILAECSLSIMAIEKALLECARTLKRGGYMIANDVYARNEDGIEALRKLPVGTCIGSAVSQGLVQERLARCGLRITWWQDCSDRLKEFSICTLSAAAELDPFDLYLAATRAKLGYFFLVAQKE